MTHRRDFKTIFEVSEWKTDSTLFREYDLAVFMIKNKKMKKNRALHVNEVVFSFRTSWPCTSCRDFPWYLNELLASNKIRGDWCFSDLFASACWGHSWRRRSPTIAIFSLPWHYLHSLNKLLVKAIRTKREWESPILWVWIKSIFSLFPWRSFQRSYRTQQTKFQLSVRQL